MKDKTMTSKTSRMDAYDAAFKGISGYTIHKDGKHIGSISFKNATCFIHLDGTRIVRNTARGTGFNRAQASFEDTLIKWAKENPTNAYGIPANVADLCNKPWIDILKGLGMEVFQAI